MNLRKLKVLENEWSEHSLDLFFESWEEIQVPRPFGRPGKYLLGDLCWLEVPGRSQCYEYPAEQFKYELRILEASRLNHRQIQALEQIIAQKLSTKKQRELYYDARSFEMSRTIGRRSRIHFNRIRDVLPSKKP